MELKALKCPNCGGMLEIEDGLDTFYCKYCGYKIILDGQSDIAYRSKVQLKGIEFKHEEKIQEQELAQERYKIELKQKNKHRDTIMILVVVIFMWGAVFFIIARSFNSDERKLGKLVDKIQVEIEKGNYNEAYIKAQSIKYPYENKQEEEKWDNTRRAIIDQIIDTEIEETGKSNHKREET